MVYHRYCEGESEGTADQAARCDLSPSFSVPTTMGVPVNKSANPSARNYIYGDEVSEAIAMKIPLQVLQLWKPDMQSDREEILSKAKK